jgi:hypothetical protein
VSLAVRSMRAGIVAAGVIMMVLGALIFFGSLGSTGTQGISGANILSEAGFGAILGFIGFIVFIAGLAASPTPDIAVSERYGQPASSAVQTETGDEWVKRRWAAEMGAPDPAAATRGPPPSSPTSTGSGPSTTNSSPRGSGNGVFCPYCGAPSKPEYRFCRSCGKEAPPE